MSLSERLNNQQAGSVVGGTALLPPVGQTAPAGGSTQAANSAPTPPRHDPAAAELRHRVHQLLIDELGPILFDNRLSEDDLRRRVNEQLQAAVALERVPLSAADKARLIQDVTDDILGYGPIDCLLREEAVTEIMVNGPDRVFVERNGKLTKDPNIRFLDGYNHKLVYILYGSVFVGSFLY